MHRFLLVLLILSVPSFCALLIPGGFTSHDLTHHIVRQVQMHTLLSEGQFPPRWSNFLNSGYGYPIFLFNYPLPAMFGEVFHLVGLNFTDSVKAILLISLPLSAIGMYLLLRTHCPSRPALVGALFYLYAPVRFLNIYVSAALGNALALAIVPFVFYGLARNHKVLGALALAALITSHNVTALMFFPLFILYAYFTHRLLSSLPMLLLGLGLSAFFWAPALAEKRFIQYDQTLGTFWHDQFATLGQLIHSPWGYGLAVPGSNDGLSFQIGLAHLFVMLLALLFLPFSKHKSAIILCILIFLFSVFLMLSPSAFLWAHVPLLNLVQFPTRFLALAVFVASCTAALLRPSKSVSILLILLSLYANRNHLSINQTFAPGEQYYLTNQSTTTSANEDLPLGADTHDLPATSKFTFLAGSGLVTYSQNVSHSVVATLTSAGTSQVQFNQYYFPGWVYTLDGQSHPGHPGLVSFSLSPGPHTFSARFTSTPIRTLADTISLLSCLLFLLWLKPRAIERQENFQNAH